jgi:hypothetical protein
MPLQYTTTDAIARRLRGRLEVNKPALGGGTGGLAAQQVDLLLIEQVGVQIEARLNVALAEIYVTPIPVGATTARIILGGIVEKLVVAEIVMTHFQQSQVPQMGGDAGFGAVIRKQAQEELESIFGGHGIYIPGLMSPPIAMPGSYRQPLVLPGVPLKSDLLQPDTLTRSYSVVERRDDAVPGRDEEIDFGYPSRYGRRLGRPCTGEGIEDPCQSGWSDG